MFLTAYSPINLNLTFCVHVKKSCFNSSTRIPASVLFTRTESHWSESLSTVKQHRRKKFAFPKDPNFRRFHEIKISWLAKILHRLYGGRYKAQKKPREFRDSQWCHHARKARPGISLLFCLTKFSLNLLDDLLGEKNSIRSLAQLRPDEWHVDLGVYSSRTVAAILCQVSNYSQRMDFAFMCSLVTQAVDIDCALSVVVWLAITHVLWSHEVLKPKWSKLTMWDQRKKIIYQIER